MAENYPNLKADETYKTLQEALMDTENRIAYVRTSYNDYVLAYNNAIQQFPGNMFAGPMHFTRQDFFQAPEGERQVVKVDLTSDQATQAPGPAPKQPTPAPKPKK